MTMWMPDLQSRSGPKYLAIADAIAADIARGALPPGAKLPPQRNLAYDIGVTLGTVTRGYAEAGRRGLVGGEVGRGTFVRGEEALKVDGFVVPEPKRPGVLDLCHAIMPVGPSGQYLAETIREIANEPNISVLAGYQIINALPHHIEAGANWVRRRIPGAASDLITMTGGAQHGILVTLMSLARPGETILVESLTYPGMPRLAHQLGHNLEAVAIDSEGLVPEALDNACAKTSARILYCCPTLHNPTGGSMSEKRREEIAEVARGRDLIVMEDDIWGGLIDNAPPPLAVRIPERTIYLTSLSKCMAGGLRVGYIYAPDPYPEQIRANVRMTNWMTPPLMAEVAARWIESGRGDEIIAWMKTETAARIEIARSHLGRFNFRAGPTSTFAWLELPDSWRADAYKAAAEEKGVRILTSETFATGSGPHPQAVRMSIGCEHSRDEIDRAFKILADILIANPTAAQVVA